MKNFKYNISLAKSDYMFDVRIKEQGWNLKAVFVLNIDTNLTKMKVLRIFNRDYKFNCKTQNTSK